MNIDRDNYEEYFLLYADNELTDSEKAEVLMFVKENKDLEEEFRMIHYTISKPDANVELADKSFLLKNDSTAFINEKNYEEIFVLYYDNELTKGQRGETVQFLVLHPKLKDEFELIGLARLTPEDSIVFPNKRLLYKKEKTGKIVPIFWRVLAAAIFPGFGLWITYSYFKTPEKTIVTSKQAVNQRPSTPIINKNNPLAKKPVNVVAQNSATNESNKNNRPQKSVRQKKDKNNSIAKNRDKNQNINEQIILRPVSQSIKNEIAINEKTIKNISKEEITAINNVALSKELQANIVQNNNDKEESVIHAQPASYVPDANNKNENYVFYDVTTDEFKKTKVGGFLKKVKRVIERSNPIGRLISGGDKQLVSN